MRIAFFTDSFDFYEDYIDGIAVIAQRFADYAVRKKIHLEIFTTGDEDSTEVLSRTVKVHRFKPKLRWYLPQYHETPLDLMVPRGDIVDYFKKNKFDVVHFTAPTSLSCNALFLGGVPFPKFYLAAPTRLASIDLPSFLKKKSPVTIPLVGSFHSKVHEYVLIRTKSRMLQRMFRDYLNFFYKDCDIVLTTSEFEKKDIKKYIKAKKFGILRSGVDLDVFNPKFKNDRFREKFRGKCILLHVGRITPEKNIDLLIKIYKRLLDKHDNIHLLMVGDGSLKNRVKSELGSNVTITGFLCGKRLSEAYASSDIFLFTSNTDTLGLVVLEAQASGLPVVISDCGGAKEIMEDGKTGFVAEADDVDDFLGKIETLIKKPEVRHEMGAAARDFAARHSWDNAFDDLMNSYRTVMKNN